MFWMIALILLILWAIGFVGSYMMGGFIHILLVVALAIIVVKLMQGRRRRFCAQLDRLRSAASRQEVQVSYRSGWRRQLREPR